MANILLHIGFPKSGSTYLQKWFELHPEMYYQPKYIAQGFLNAWEVAKYAQFNSSAPSNYILSCEDLTLFQSVRDRVGYRDTYDFNHRTFQENICNMLYDLFPTAKILIVTRGYTTLFTSIYSQYLAMAGASKPQAFANANQKLFTSMLDYDYVIDAYRKKFGSERVIILPYELMRDNRKLFLSLIEKEMNIHSPFEFEDRKINAAFDKKVLTAYQLISESVCKLISLFPRSTQEKIYSQYAHLIRKDEPHFLPRLLSKLINKPLQIDGVNTMVSDMKGKAELLRNEPLYAPYLTEYLLT